MSAFSFEPSPPPTPTPTDPDADATAAEQQEQRKKLTLLTMTERDSAFLTSVLAFIDDPRTVVAALTVLRNVKPRFIPTKALLSNVICSASADRRTMFGSDHSPEISISKGEADTMTYILEGSSLEIGCTFLRKLYDIVRDAIPIEYTPSMIHRPSIDEYAFVTFLHHAKDLRTLVVYEEDGLKVSLSLTSNKCQFVSCKKVVMWACCQRNSAHVCSECTVHASRCSECSGLVCRENCFWGSGMGEDLCISCGQLCSQCDRVVLADEIFICNNYSCSCEELCLGCAAEETRTCAECGEDYCEECVETAGGHCCDRCDNYFCESCYESRIDGETRTCAECGEKYCEECVEDAGEHCDHCDSYFCNSCYEPKMCEECSHLFCPECYDEELNPHPKYKDDPGVYICNSCLPAFEVEKDP